MAGCCICDDAYGTGYVCPTCRADPANAGWHEGREVQLGPDEVLSDSDPWSGSVRERPRRVYEAVCRELVQDPHARFAEVAAKCGCSRRYVREVFLELLERFRALVGRSGDGNC
jgi:hypothetical protein